MQLKCSGCSDKLLPTKYNDFYYCCSPFKISKLYCLNCRRKKESCNQCKNNKSRTYNRTQKSEVEKYYKQNQTNKVQAKKTQQNKSQSMSINNTTKPNEIKKTISMYQCFFCTRNLNQMKISSFSHPKCQTKICYPCLYRIYTLQKRKLEDQKNKRVDQVSLSLNCCIDRWNISLTDQNFFKQDLCIFYGVHKQRKQLNFNIHNKFRFCGMCFKKESQTKNKCQSLKLLLDEINIYSPKECLFCQKETKITDYLNGDGVYQKAFNRKLCLNCFDTYGKRFQNTLDLLKSWKPNHNISQLCNNQADLNYFQCSEPTCQRNVVCIFETYKLKIVDKKVEVDLIQWRDNKKYCGICLYFKYENKRNHFIFNKQKGLCSQSQTEEFQASKKGYQSLFSDKCMICLTYPTNQNRQRLLVDEKNNNFKINQQEKYKLSCQYCQKCLCILSQGKLQGNYLKIKHEMCKRDPDLQKILLEVKSEKQFLLKKYSFWSLLKNSEFNEFWPIIEGQKEIKLSQKQKQKLEKKKEPEKVSQINNFRVDKATPKQSPNQSESKHEQFDDGVDSGKSMIKEVKNITNANTNQSVSQKMEKCSPIQPLKIQFPKIQIILSEQLKTFSMIQNQTQANDQSQSMNNERNDGEENSSFENHLEKIQLQFTTPQVVKSICDLPNEEIQVKLIPSNPKYESINDNGQKKYLSRKNNNTPSKQNITKDKNSNNSNVQNACKVRYCRSQGNKNTAKLLNLGMLCDNCYIAYLLGMVDLKEEIDSSIYSSQLNSARQWMKSSLEMNNNQ